MSVWSGRTFRAPYFPAKESRISPGYPFRTCLVVGGEYMPFILSVNEQLWLACL